MNEVFVKYKEFFEKRYDVINVAKLGEDSIRYDFFSALSQVKQLQPWQIQLEYPIDETSYRPRKTIGSKRGENPQIDLWVYNSDLRFCVEFGFFRRNTNDNGDISVTENLLKMFNDFVRIGLHSKNNNSKSYFVCVADEKMLNTSLVKFKKFAKFPASTYNFSWIELKEIVGLYKSAKKIDDRFLQKFEDLNLSIKAQLVFDEQIYSSINTLKTKILIWEVFVS